MVHSLYKKCRTSCNSNIELKEMKYNFISKKKNGNQPDKERLISAVTYLFFKHCEHMFSVHICSAFTYVQRSHMKLHVG